MISAHKNVRILLSLLKQYNVKHFVLSPGSRNISIVKSLEDDPYFKCYSVVDERSAAYFAIGLSLESRTPVGMVCTSAQATRNYIPGLTEAYYRKAPILAITTDYDENYIDQLNMQALRQMSIPTDSANISVDIPIIKDINDEYLVTRRINEALDSLFRSGGGPAHVNVRIDKHWLQGNNELETARKITRYTVQDKDWPTIGEKRVLLVIGQHHPFTQNETIALENFARKHNAAIYVNHISNYIGEKSVHGNICFVGGCEGLLVPELVISIGRHLGDYSIDSYLKGMKIEHWRISEDGNYGDTYNSLTKIFECTEQYFFEKIVEKTDEKTISTFFENWSKIASRKHLPEDFPLSHAYVAKKLSPIIPSGSNLHFSILNSLRFWEFFTIPNSIKCYSNVAGFGIDGCLSTFLGQSVGSDALNFLIIGDLSFFYDMNSIGIRHLKNNIRIVLVNNKGGAEFRLFNNTADEFGDNSNKHIAASGHFGDSAEGWVINNHFTYLSVKNKDELDSALNILIQPSEKPILMEVFTTMKDESDALLSIKEINEKPKSIVDSLKGVIPADLKKGIRKIIGK